LGEAEKEKGPVNLFPAERPDSGCPGRVIRKLLINAMDGRQCVKQRPVAQLGEPEIEIHPVNEFPGERRASGWRGWWLR
jgi:hypothetical protein